MFDMKHKSSTVVCSCHYHVAPCPKYRRPVLVDSVDERFKEAALGKEGAAGRAGAGAAEATRNACREPGKMSTQAERDNNRVQISKNPGIHFWGASID